MSNHTLGRHASIAPVLRGASYDGRSGAVVRCFPDVDAAGDGVLAIPESVAFTDDGPNVKAILDRIAGFIDERAAFPSRVSVGRYGYAVGGRPEDVAAFDGYPGAAPDLRRRAAAFSTGSVVSEAPSAGGRSQVAANRAPATAGADGAASGPAAGRVAVVTGGAQGFGFEIAASLAEAGGFVFLADVNVDGAAAAAKRINDEHARTCAFAVGVNVSDEESVATMITEVLATCGGIDLFVSNAGVLRAGSVKELSAEDFAFVTNVNYTGFFLCAKHAAPVMALQNAAALAKPAGERYFADIIQINSKSGLEGSNKNGAYAGSKFGGIGLVQSFAMELVDDSVKVNAVCPGNFFDGPLWSDPEKGLFVQYLNAGKVPGAKSVADVKEFYENKVPMKRGCTGPDVVKAILYLVDQVYETGQALPVTGGQVMLR